MSLLDLVAASSYYYTYPTTTTTASSGSVFAAFAAIWAIIMIPTLICAVLGIIAMWKIFTKAGVEGWKSIVPILNIITLFQIVNINPLFILVALIPVVGGIAFAIITILAWVRICKGFGKSDGFIVGIILLPFIFQLILAFDKSTWDASRINMQSFEFLNKDKNYSAPAGGAAAGNANNANNSNNSDPWVNGQA